MDLLTFIVVLALIGFCLWLVVTYVPMPDPWQKLIIAVVVLIVVLWLVRALVPGASVPRL